MVVAEKKEEKKMKMMTSFELQNKQEKELAVLFDLATKSLAMSRQSTPERRAVLGTLENISRARAFRFLKCGN